jgi:type IV pilus biogenesis protein CpaD/CtpE
MLKKFSLVCATFSCLLLMQGCEKQYKADDNYISGFKSLNVSENRVSKFFALDNNFELSESTLLGVKKMLNDAKAEGIGNVSFVIISNRPIGIQEQEKIREIIQLCMYQAGFLNSRITDSGLCIYATAKPGVRIDILKYNVEEPDSRIWSEYIGDLDTNKEIPRFGVSEVCNFREMIANDADLLAPRKYKGAKTTDAVAAIEATGSKN